MDSLPEPVWLDIRFQRRRWTFKFAADAERALVVGSMLRAHIRIDRPGIAPIHFHFERAQHGVRLVPAHYSGLCLDGVPLHRARLLDERSLLDFAGVRFDLVVSRNPPPIRTALASAHSERSEPRVDDRTLAFRPLFDVHVRR